jgi:hypothetical protein
VDANSPNSQQQQQQQQQQSKGGVGAVIASVVNTVMFAVAAANAVWHVVMRDGTVAAMGREAIKDVRSTMHEMFFGKGDQNCEPGAPLNPTQGEVAADRKGSVYGTEHFPIHRSPSQIADSHRGNVQGQDNQVVRSPSQIVDDRRGGVHGQDDQAVRSPSAIVDGRGGVHGQNRGGNGNVLTQEEPPEPKGSEQEKAKEGNANNSQDQGNKGQSQDKPPAKEPEWAERRDGKGWAQVEEERERAKQEGNAGNDQNQRQEGRVLPKEQREQQREQDHGHSL